LFWLFWNGGQRIDLDQMLNTPQGENPIAAALVG